MAFSKTTILAFCLCLGLCGCIQPGPPKLPETRPNAVSNRDHGTDFTHALSDLNLLLDVYFPPNKPDILYYIKPIYDKTNIAQSSGGEIPSDMGDMVRAAFGDVHNKIRILDQYTNDDQIQVNVQGAKGEATQAISQDDSRPRPDFVVSGSISIFDRGLEGIARKGNLMGEAGVVDIDGGAGKSLTKSHLGVILLVSRPSGVSVPGRFGADMDVWHGKDSVDIGFAIKGIGLGYTAEGVAIQGRHQALKMIADLSVVQIVGRTLAIPYWRIPLNQASGVKLYEEDPIVYQDWIDERYSGPLARGYLIPYMQSLCIANGDDSVQVNGRGDDPAFQASLARFAEQYHVTERVNRQYAQYPSFELYKAMELNRVLDRNRAARAWNAYITFATKKAQMKGNFQTEEKSPPAQPLAAPAKASSDGVQERKQNTQTQQRRKSTVKPAGGQPALPDDLDRKMDGLL